MVSAGRCEDYGASPALMTLADVGSFCDRCADRHVAELTGFPMLPEPPEPIVLVGPDDRTHRMVFRLWRAPTGTAVELVETDVPGEGYRFAVLGAHDGDVDNLIGRVRRLQARRRRVGRSVAPATPR